jgi:hypothetical protein
MGDSISTALCDSDSEFEEEGIFLCYSSVDLCIPPVQQDTPLHFCATSYNMETSVNETQVSTYRRRFSSPASIFAHTFLFEPCATNPQPRQ